ncbi:MAG: hypothetical protein ACYTG7_12470 [Planctomycetota bacterium]|jgi:hypothetical protein
MFVPVTPPPPSPRAMELGQKMVELIRIFKKEYPNLNMTDIRQAMHIAQRNISTEMGGWAGASIAVLIGISLALVLGFLVLFLSRSGGGLERSWILIAVIGLMIVALGVVIVVRLRGR